MTARGAGRYPGIAKAPLEMAYDNGGINRHRSEARQRWELNRFLARYPLPSEQLVEIDQWLAALSKGDLHTAVAGEETEMRALLAQAPTFTNKLLEDIF